MKIQKLFNRLLHHRNNLFFVYLIVLLFLFLGVFIDSGAKFLIYLFCYSAIFILTYILLNRFFTVNHQPAIIPKGLKNIISQKNIHVFTVTTFSVTALFIVFHFIYLNDIPTVSALLSHNSFDIYKMRNAVSENSSTLVNYLSSFVLKTIIPFMVLYFFAQRRWFLFSIVLFVSAFYCLSLIAKSFLVTAFIPVLFYAFFTRKYLAFAGFLVLIVVGLIFLVYVSNPALRGGDTNTISFSAPAQEEGGNGVVRSIRGLSDRVFITPGKIVSGWFRIIPEKKPFLQGCGYRFMAPLLHCEYHEYSSELYPELFPEKTALGYHGSVNVASFMYDYSNFGWVGIIFSAVLMAIIFVLLNLVFAGNDLLKFCINIYYVLVLSSSALSTLLFSGGWGLMVLLFFICRKNFSPLQ